MGSKKQGIERLQEFMNTNKSHNYHRSNRSEKECYRKQPTRINSYSAALSDIAINDYRKNLSEARKANIKQLMSSELKDEFRRLKEDDDNASKPISKPKIGHRKHLDSLCSSSVEHDDSSSDSTDVRSKFVIDTNKVGEGRSQLIRNGSKSYQAFGVNKVLKTEAKRIVAKLGNYFDEDLLEQESDNEKPVEKEDPADDESFVIDSELEEIVKKENDRYYTKNSSTQCRRCQEYGHVAKMCPNETQKTCHYCLGDHMKEDCDTSTCFKCGELGHRGDECPKIKYQICNRCRKRGHIAKECTFLINFRDERTLEHLDERRSNMHCVSCLNPGHLECYIRGNEMKKLFKRDKIYLRDEWDSFVQSNSELYIHDKEVMKARKHKRLSELSIDDMFEKLTLKNFHKENRSSSKSDNKSWGSTHLKKRKKKKNGSNFGGNRGNYESEFNRPYKRQRGY